MKLVWGRIRAFIFVALLMLGGFLVVLGMNWMGQARTQAQCLAKLQGVAKRLNVGPTSYATTTTVLACDGRYYDIVVLVSALLDRMDKEAKHK